MGKFPRSMSDFKPGERTLEGKGVLANAFATAVQRPLSGIVCDPSNAGFILCLEEKHGTV